MLHLIDKAFEATISLMETPTITDDELALFLTLVYTLIPDKLDEMDHDSVFEPLTQMMGKINLGAILELNAAVDDMKSAGMPDRQARIAYYRQMHEIWRGVRDLCEKSDQAFTSLMFSEDKLSKKATKKTSRKDGARVAPMVGSETSV
jgi:hypothetical protein